MQEHGRPDRADRSHDPVRAAREHRRAAGRTPGSPRTMQDQPDHGEETYRGSGRLTGKRAVITGGDSGIGRAVALAFAREGADVVLSYLPERGGGRRRDGAAGRGGGPQGGPVPGRHPRRGHLPADHRHGGRRARRHRHPGQQRGVPDGPAGRHRRHHHRAVRPGDEDQPVRDVLALPEGASRTCSPARRSSTPPRSRPSARRRSCSTTPPPRPASSTSPRRWPRSSPRRASGSTPSRPARSGRR